MDEQVDSSTNVIPFPRRLRLVEMPAAALPPAKPEASVLVEHDGQFYRLVDLVGQLTPSELQACEATASRSWQAVWDEAVRWWPALAAEIAAGAKAVG